eukprot:s4973_g2.t1
MRPSDGQLRHKRGYAKATYADFTRLYRLYMGYHGNRGSTTCHADEETRAIWGPWPAASVSFAMSLRLTRSPKPLRFLDIDCLEPLVLASI